MGSAPSSRQGRKRRLDRALIQRLDLIAALGSRGVPGDRALEIAETLQGSIRTVITAGLVLQYDPAAHLDDLDRRLGEAAERVVTRRRGRPPRGS